MSLTKWDYEPDAPAYTPRIGGCVLPSRDAALSIIKRREDGSSQREYFEIPMVPGQARLMATYSGENRDPLPSFSGGPETVFLKERTAENTAEAVYKALKPKSKNKDFRVAVACVFAQDLIKNLYTMAIINRHERKK